METPLPSPLRLGVKSSLLANIWGGGSLALMKLVRVNVSTGGTATQQKVEREMDYPVLRAKGYETTEGVGLAEPGEIPLLGVRTLGPSVSQWTTRGIGLLAPGPPRRVPLDQ